MRKHAWILIVLLSFPLLVLGDVQIKSGATTDTLTIEPGTKAARVTIRGADFGSLGSFAISTDNGGTVMAAGLAAGSEIYQFRWTHATNLALIRSVRISMGTVLAFVAGRMVFEMVPARAFTAAGSGGTAATVTGNNNKRRTSMSTTLVGEIRTASTAALGVGTKTLDTQGVGNIAGGAPTTVGMVIFPPVTVWDWSTAGEYPLVLATNEGFIIRATVPGTGTWNFGVTTEWTEVTAFASP